MKEKICNRIREAMRIRSLKQSELVEKTGIGKSSISTYLSGEYEPKQKNIYKIAEALDVSEAWLMGYDVPLERELTTNKLKEDESRFVREYRKLNHLGKQEAIKRVEELTYVDKYIKNNEICAMVAEEKEVYSTSTCHSDNKEKLNIIREGIKNDKKASEILGDAFDNVAAHGDDLTDEEMEQMCKMVLEDIMKELE